MKPLRLQRLGVLMEPEPGDPREAEGVLNPGAARGPDGGLYLFPRMVAEGNYSRIGVARVVFDGRGDPVGVERLGVALEPEEDYELRPGGGGCEDPRVTFVEPLGRYVMSYVANAETGPRVALAASDDLLRWERLGLARFADPGGHGFGHADDKDACVFPAALPDDAGEAGLALLHRPLLPGRRPEEGAQRPAGTPADPGRESLWISYASMPGRGGEPGRVGPFRDHHRLAAPVAGWERLKIGGGTPPVMTRHGWLLVYHGVSHTGCAEGGGRDLRYSAGVMVLSKDQPREVLYRSPEPVLTPTLPEERSGAIADVVFPTGIDRRDDLGQPDRFDVYYGMADDRIGVARLDLPPDLLGG